jgi:opacity protein-like surface antigen
MMLRSITLAAAALVALCMFAMPAEAQERSRIGVFVQGVGVQPIFGLNERFDPHATFSVGVGQWMPDALTYVEVRYQQYSFGQRDQVTLREDTLRPAYDTSVLGMGLEMRGAGVFMQRSLSAGRAFRPFLLGGITLHHWEESRAEVFDEEIGLNVPMLERPNQWSAGFTGGVGSEFYLMRSAALNVGVNYSIVMGELWPTLALGLENVSTFHYVTAGVGLRYYF